jgi:hypothetical protein
MIRARRVVAIVTAIFSVTAFLLALWGGGALLAVQSLLATVGLASSQQDVLAYPLGNWVFLVYALGFAAALYALRRPRAMGVALIALGVCALLFGGPIARIWGVVAILSGLVLVAGSAGKDESLRSMSG